MLEIRHLRTLIALAESGSVSRAAERLHLTQSALSHQLRALESHYGLAVVRRKGQTVALSEAGERLLELAHKVVADIQTAERDLERIKGRAAGTLRIALECHTCFDWLMPVMDAFRQRWPEVELDLVSGFHADPLALLKEGRADVVIGSERKPRQGVVFAPLFRFEILAVLPVDHPLRSRKWLEAKDFADQTLITYPVPEERIDLIRQVLAPAGIAFTRRTTELTIAVLQLVASRRGLAALPSWGLRSYVDYEYVVTKRVGREGVWSDLYAAMARDYAQAPFAQDFIETAKSICFARLPGLMALE
ncbi:MULTISPECIES: LysR family transcriptional regulator [Ralstonia solanacearum species complex]|uniref:HTH-type transcriptional regulator MetR n=4 Tax=Ralstonia solanacearum species complex TaxID=3116862 RepID=A0A0K1ZRU7_RALSL|nr:MULTISPECIES: LysR family transcriptional regulator [Ralstonia]AKZ28709.1 LysR family transcriptional regulator [Ralstonia solanacearum]APC66332.1 LysR family transcriptional regulator [Ralstonia solanacearum OE1-1]APF89247.1 LysR family transcriptional regulator [Ralstonia solanacearum FJAT-1458]ARS59322.1 LysR family transcriptional regulator [Ralstonia solanacearum FJAT-91]ESS49936.1 putative transcriptional activator METR transcription regulator protein [Ralstonia solanacearum SD54]